MAAPKGNKYAKGNSGRPKSRTEAEIKAMQRLICLQISTSSKSIQTILKTLSKKVDKVPDLSTVMDWLSDNKEFAEQYARAKEEQCEFMAEEILDISDDDSLDMAFTEEGKQFVDKEHINRSRLRVDTRKWILSKLKPKKYGDKIGVEHSGDIGLTINLIDKFGKPVAK
jgi:hypothetical protein